MGPIAFDYGANEVSLAINSYGATLGVTLKQKLSTGALIGVIGGSVVAAILLIGGVACWVKKNRAKSTEAEA